jgi:hypothetical protein
MKIRGERRNTGFAGHWRGVEFWRYLSFVLHCTELPITCNFASLKSSNHASSFRLKFWINQALLLVGRARVPKLFQEYLPLYHLCITQAHHSSKAYQTQVQIRLNWKLVLRKLLLYQIRKKLARISERTQHSIMGVS